MSWKWAKVDDKGVARFVSPEASKYIQLSVGPLDLVNHTDGPLPLIKAIYNDALERGVITDPTKLLPFIDGQAYLTVECTGFAHSKVLPETAPEGRGRTEEGLLPFERAVAAGREQLDRSFAVGFCRSWRIKTPMRTTIKSSASMSHGLRLRFFGGGGAMSSSSGSSSIDEILGKTLIRFF